MRESRIIKAFDAARKVGTQGTTERKMMVAILMNLEYITRKYTNLQQVPQKSGVSFYLCGGMQI